MASSMLITSAGLREVVNAEHDGTAPIKLRKLFKNPRCQAGWNKNVLFGFS